MSPGLYSSVSHIDLVSPRILVATFKQKYVNLRLIVCYGPTEKADEQAKDVFF